MNQRSVYKTKQKESILHYLESVPRTHVTVGDVCDYFKNQGITIGQSTIYRQLERLVAEGVLNKYIIDINSPACFEYIGNDCHKDEVNCFHCKCEKCGKLIHLHCDELNELQHHLTEHHQFKMNAKRTVFYGLCEECSQTE